MTKANAMFHDRPSSSFRRASRAWLLSIALCAIAAVPGTGRAHEQGGDSGSQASAATSREMTGRLEGVTVIGETGIAMQYPMLVTGDGQRYRLENAGAAAAGAVVTVSGRLSGRTIVADIVRGAGPQSSAVPPRSLERRELTGTIRMFHLDYPDGTSEYGYSLIADSGRGNVIDLGVPLPGIENGARAKVSGPVDARGYVSVDTIEILAPPARATTQPKASINAFAALGTQSYAVAPLQFPNNASSPWTYGGVPTTTGQINTSVFGVAPNKSAAEYYKEVSYGAQLLSGFVISGSSAAWLQATVARPTACSTNAQLDAVLSTIESEAKAKAATAANNPVANLDWNSYSGGILYVIDSLPCGWSGLGYIGFARSYTNGTASLGVVGHEMGHNFGLYHAGSLRCSGVIASSGCTVTEYGDPFVIMGNIAAGHFNAYQKDVLNYIPGKVATHGSGSTTYTLGPIESPGQSLYAVQIPTGNTKRTYWVEFRQGIGFDAGITGISALGAQVRIAYPFENQCSGCTGTYDDTQFLDMTPPSTFSDGALLNGQTYTDASTNVSIQVTAASASSLSVLVTTGGGTATSTTLASSANPSTQGQPVTFTATITGTNPTGTVTFKDSGTTICGAVAFSAGSGNTRTAPCATSSLSAGVHSITANYSGDGSNGSSSSSPLSQTVKTASTTAVASSQNPSTSGASVTFTATVAGSAPTGNVAFTSDGASISGCTAQALTGSGNSRTAACTTSSLTVSTHSIVASYAGDSANGASASTPLSQVVNGGGGPTATTTVLASSQNPSTSGASVTFTATVTGSAPTGNVAFTSDAVSIGGCTAQALSGSGNSRTATCTTSALTVAAHSIVASYGGNGSNLASASAPLSQVVNSAGPAPTTTTLASSQNPSTSGQSVTFTATVTGASPSGSVGFTADGAAISGCANVVLAGLGNSRTAQCTTVALAVGARVIVASYGGDAGNAVSASGPLSQVVIPVIVAPTATTLTSANNPSPAGAPVALIATVTASTPVQGGLVSFTANGTPIAGCTNLPVVAVASARTATCNASLASGAYGVVASYGGDAASQPSASLVFSQVVSFAAIGNTVQFAAAGYSVNETAGSVMITVTRIGDATAAAQVSYGVVAGTATPGADYTPSSGTLTWAANDATTRTITVPILDDSIGELPETFAVFLSNPAGAALGATSGTTVTIFDDENAAPATAGIATVVSNPYGAPSISGGTLSGNTISSLANNAVIQLGSVAGAPGSFAKIDFQGLDIGAGNTLTVRSGAPGQTVYLTNVNGAAATITGSLLAQGGNGAPAPRLVVQSAQGLTIGSGGFVRSASGLALDTLGATTTTGGSLVNQGTVDGGSSLVLTAAKVNGGGAFLGNAMSLSTFGNLNNPANGPHFVANGLQLYPSTGTSVSVALAGYGASPQVVNLMMHGDASLSMPSAWPAGSTLPPNNLPVMPAEVRAAGAGDPPFGGGSMIVQASGKLTLDGGASNDFVFPGGVVFIAGTTLDVHGVAVDNGWTTSGAAFQGVFFQAPDIVDTVAANGIAVRTNNLNWANFSARPNVPVHTWTLQQQGSGASWFVASDSTAPHLNFYSIVSEAGAAGQCYPCLVNGQVMDFSVAP